MGRVRLSEAVETVKCDQLPATFRLWSTVPALTAELNFVFVTA